MRKRRRRAARHLSRALFVLPVAVVSQQLLANTGIQVPLSQYQAGAEQTTQVTNGNFSSRSDVDLDGAFETATGWTRTGNMFVNTPVNPPANTAAVNPFSAQARLVNNQQPGNQDPHSYTQPIDRNALTPNANYVISAYMWNMGRTDPSQLNGELVSVKVQDPTNTLNNVSATLEGTGLDAQTASTGRLMYILVNEAQMRSWGGAEIAVTADVGTFVEPPLPEVWAQWDNVSFTRSDQFAVQTWIGTAGGNFNDAAKWQSSQVPGGASAVAALIGSTGAQTVSMDAGRTLGVLRLGGTGSYTVNGSALTLDVTADGGGSLQGLPEVTVDSGSHTLAVPLTFARNGLLGVATGASLTVTGDITSNNVSLTKLGGGTATVTHVRTGTANVAVDAGTLRVAPNSTAAGTSKVNNLVLAAGTRFDLTDNKLITNDPVGTGTAGGGAYTAGSVSRMVQTASNGGAWDGPGLTTSMSDATGGLTSIGVALASDVRDFGAGTTLLFGGQTITTTSTLAMYTYAGDANLDGQITGDDYSGIDFSIQDPNNTGGWFNGDFNYDGFVSGDDYSAIDFNILAQGAPFPTGGSAASASGLAAVPEPTMLGLGAVGLLALRRRRRV